jgi:hypothetical protein
MRYRLALRVDPVRRALFLPMPRRDLDLPDELATERSSLPAVALTFFAALRTPRRAVVVAERPPRAALALRRVGLAVVVDFAVRPRAALALRRPAPVVVVLRAVPVFARVLFAAFRFVLVPRVAALVAPLRLLVLPADRLLRDFEPCSSTIPMASATLRTARETFRPTAFASRLISGDTMLSFLRRVILITPVFTLSRARSPRRAAPRAGIAPKLFAVDRALRFIAKRRQLAAQRPSKTQATRCHV